MTWLWDLGWAGWLRRGLGCRQGAPVDWRLRCSSRRWALGSWLSVAPLRLRPVLAPARSPLVFCLAGGAQCKFLNSGPAWVVEGGRPSAAVAPVWLENPAGVAASLASFTNRLTLPLILHRPTVPVSLCPCVPLPSQASRSRPVLSLQTGCLWSWSAWLSSSSSSSWASAGVSAAPTPAAVTSGAPAARTSAAAQRPVSAPHVPTPAGLPPGFRGRRQPGAGFPGQRHWSGGCEVSSGPRGIFCSR